MFLAFVGNPCPPIYLPMIVYTSICLRFIKIIPNLLITKYVCYNEICKITHFEKKNLSALILGPSLKVRWFGQKFNAL